MKTAFVKLREVLQESYWFIPTVMAIGAVLVALLSIYYGQNLGAKALGGIGWIYTRDPQAARDLLGVVGGSLITVAGVVFSVTLVALTNASSQFGTRILRTFARDTGNKVVLGAFVGTFLYCLLVMRTITGGTESFVPHLSVLIAILLAMICFALLIYFIHHVIGILQSDNVVSALARDLRQALTRIYPKQIGDEPPQHNLCAPQDFHNNNVPVFAEQTNYLESVDPDGVLELATKNHLLIKVEVQPGDFVLEGSVLARVYPASKADDRVRRHLAKTFNFNGRRSYVQDIGLAFEQLVLVAIRAISPAVNNQLLAMQCVDRIAEGLAFMATRQMPSTYRADDAGELRVIAPHVEYAVAVKLGLELISESAAASPGVCVHVLHSMAKLIAVVPSHELHAPVMKRARSLRDRALQTIRDDEGKRQVEAAYALLLERDRRDKAA